MASLPEGDEEILLLHNPRCSKSRAARALLEERRVPFRERHYLEQPLTRAELGELRRRLGRPAREWVRRGEAAFREAALSEASAEDAWLDAVAAHPVLLERPIAVKGRRAVLARPPERVLDLL